MWTLCLLTLGLATAAPPSELAPEDAASPPSAEDQDAADDSAADDSAADDSAADDSAADDSAADDSAADDSPADDSPAEGEPEDSVAPVGAAEEDAVREKSVQTKDGAPDPAAGAETSAAPAAEAAGENEVEASAPPQARDGEGPSSLEPGSESPAAPPAGTDSAGSEATPAIPEGTPSGSEAEGSAAAAVEDPAKDAGDDETVAELARQACMAQFQEDSDRDRARDCLNSVKGTYPSTSAAVKSEAALEVLTTPAAVEGLSLPSFLKPGRLELAFVSGVMGVWAGGTVGVLGGTNADQMGLRVEPWMVVLGAGSLAVAGGLGSAAGGYFLAEGLELEQGDVWAFTAGATWGASYAIGLLPSLYEQTTPAWYLNDEIIALTPLLGAGTGAATGLTLALVLDPTISEVSMMNTGGWVSGLVGTLVGFNVAIWTEGYNKSPVTTTAAFYAGFKTAGLLAGVAASQVLELTWGETLAADFGAGIGGLAATSVVVAFLLSPAAQPTFAALGLHGETEQKSMITLASVSAVAGLTTGIAVTTVGLWGWHRFAGRPFLRDFKMPFQVTMTPPVIAIDDQRNVVTLFPGVAGRF